MNSQYYIWDALEMIAGPYESCDIALKQMQFMIDELYLLDDYHDPYVSREADENDYFNMEDWEYTHYKHIHENEIEFLEDLPSKENFKRRVR